MNQLVITLQENDLLSLWAAVVDEDGGAALAFLKERILPQIPAKGVAPCDSTRLNPFLLGGLQRTTSAPLCEDRSAASSRAITSRVSSSCSGGSSPRKNRWTTSS